MMQGVAHKEVGVPVTAFRCNADFFAVQLCQSIWQGCYKVVIDETNDAGSAGFKAIHVLRDTACTVIHIFTSFVKSTLIRYRKCRCIEICDVLTFIFIDTILTAFVKSRNLKQRVYEVNVIIFTFNIFARANNSFISVTAGYDHQCQENISAYVYSSHDDGELNYVCIDDTIVDTWTLDKRDR